MRKQGRTDANQEEIIKYLRSAGISVAITSGLGAGFGDIVCGFRGVNYIFEVKDGEKVPSARKLTPDEKKFHASWKGQISVIENPLDAMRIMGMI